MPRLPLEQEAASARCAADEAEPEEIEGFRFADPAPLAVGRSTAAKLDQAGLFRMKRQCELLQSRSHRIQEGTGVVLMFEADADVVGEAHDDHIARSVAPSPALGPEIEHKMKVDVGKERRDHRALARSLIIGRDDPVFKNARFELFLDQADDALVADPMFNEANQPGLTDTIEERPNVGVQDVVHLRPVDPDNQGVQRIMLAAPPAGNHSCIRGSPPRRSRSARQQLRVGRPCLPGQPLRVGAVCHPPSEYTGGGLVAPGTLPDGPVRADLRACDRDRPRSPATSPIHSRRGLPLKCEERRPEHRQAEMVVERGEPFLLPLPCGLAYALQRL